MLKKFEIQDCTVRNILDSRGTLTVEATIRLPEAVGVSSAPSGASTGETEVKAFPQGGALSSLDMFYKEVRKGIIGLNALDQYGFDTFLEKVDGTGNFSSIGGNLATALSIANAKAVANALQIPLYRYVGGNFARKMPKPLGNVLGGGKHSRNGTTIQEFFVSTQSDNMLQCINTNIRVHRRVGEKLSEKYPDLSIGVGDERAWTCNIPDIDAVDLVRSAAAEIEHESRLKILVGSDLASTSFYEKGKYIYKDGPKTVDQQKDFVVSLVKDHGFRVIEDPLVDSDYDGFADITARVGDRCLIIGDDLYTTNPDRIKVGIEKKSTNAALIKVNQIGTLSKTVEAVNLVNRAGWKTVISHRSGETTDDFIAHLGVAFGSEMIKSGTIGGERLAKLNELIRIQEDF